MTIVAGRFVPLAGSFAFDLGTGERVYLRIDSLDEAVAQQQWSEVCAALAGVWHSSLAECLDFGQVSSRHRFVAFRAARQTSVRAIAADWDRLRREVQAFLARCDIRASVRAEPFADTLGQPVVVPDPAVTGLDVTVPSRRTGAEARWFGIRLVRRPVLHAIAELFTFEPRPGITLHQVDAARGSGGRTFLRHCAGEARRRGFIPVNTTSLAWIARQPGAQHWLAMLSAHHLAVLHDGRTTRLEQRPDLLRWLLRIASHGPAPRLVVELIASLEPRAPLQLLPLDAQELVRMTVVPVTWRRQHAIVEHAARRSRGLPGEFVRRLMRGIAKRPRPPGRPPFTVHECSTEYASVPGHGLPGSQCVPAVRTTALPATVWVEAANGAAVLWRRGRHAAADRLLRQAEAAAMRRGHWPAATDAALARSRFSRSRGQISAAEQSLLAALDHGERADDTGRCLTAAIELGTLKLEDARVELAEGLLRAALTTATLVDADVLALRASGALALCLWWQGRHEEAHTLLVRHDPPTPLAPALPTIAHPLLVAAPELRSVHVWQHCVGARVALALGDAAGARRHLDEASGAAPCPDHDGVAAAVRRLEARWHVAVGDVSGFRRAIDEASRLASAGRLPLDALRAKVGCLEGALALGSPHEGAQVVRRLERARRRRLPGLLAFRIRLALAFRSGVPPPDRLAAECLARRLGGLWSSWPSSLTRPGTSDTRSPMYDDVIEVMRICQEEEAGEAVKKVLEIVRGRTRAATADVTGPRGAVLAVLPSNARATCAAARAVETGVTVEPNGSGAGIEAAVPLRFGGRVVGALGCRWGEPPPLDGPRLMGFLAAAAAAAAPCVASMVEQLEPPRGAPLAAELLGDSAALHEIRRAVARAADAPFPVLIQGESGSGKELVARAIHRAGPRRHRPLCALNCAALPDELLEAELFGHARGAFTGAVAERAGLFEEADGGVLFLDEVGELSPRAQAKLLRAIQEGEVRRVGETFARRVDVRLVAATNRPLEQEVAAGRFRRDLRYRLDVIRIVVPPLRDRPEDVPVLAQQLWQQAAGRIGSRAQLGNGVLAALARYDWPGNVRELQNVLASLAVSAPRRGIVGVSALPAAVAVQAARVTETRLDAARRVFEERFVRAALARSGGHRGRAAAELGLTRQGLAKLMGRLGMVIAGESGGDDRARAS